MSVQTSPQSLLIEVVGNQTDATTQDEQAVQDAHSEVILSLLRGEGATVAEEIDKADGDAAVNVENQVVFLRGGDGLNGDGVVKELVRSKVL